MKRTRPMLISEIIDSVIKSEGLEDEMLAHRALSAWGSVVGNHINRLTTMRRVNGSTLLVHIASGVVREELSMQRTPLLEALNRALGKEVIKEIRFI